MSFRVRSSWTVSLPREERTVLETGFDRSLADVRLQVWPDRLPWPRARACAVGNTVHLRETDYLPGTQSGLNLLAHEVAHLVQKSRGACRPASIAAAEADAAAAAVAVLSGRHAVCCVADDSAVPRFWGFAGHYYTVYFVLLAAGVDDLTAGQMAFYSQMPDQIKELAAVPAGFDMVVNRAKAKVLGRVDHAAAQRAAEKVARDYEVQEGLHCLNGGPSSVETIKRASYLRSLPFGSFVFGIALHPYGDSFAHRQMHDAGRMYDPGFGHAKDGHGPDHIQERRGLYMQYLEGLYDIVAAKTPHRSRPVDRTGLMARALEYMSMSGDAAQGAQMRQIAARDFGRVMNAYRPENERARSWAHFRERHPELGGHLLGEALALAHRWSLAQAA